MCIFLYNPKKLSNITEFKNKNIHEIQKIKSLSMLDPYSNNTVHVKVSEETYKSEQGIIHQVLTTEYTLISFYLFLNKETK
jgi:hypothetical protein